MLVPTIAFAFWIVTLPNVMPPVSIDDLQAATEMQAASDAEDTTGERVKLKLVTPEIVALAEGLLTLPMGTERFMTLDGRRLAFVLEQHYHPPGFVGGPNGWHKGVTVYEVK
jgi:hypothetical protein